VEHGGTRRDINTIFLKIYKIRGKGLSVDDDDIQTRAKLHATTLILYVKVQISHKQSREYKERVMQAGYSQKEKSAAS